MKNSKKIIIGIVCVILFISVVTAISASGSDSNNNTPNGNIENGNNPPIVDNATMGEKNALRQANNYIRTAPFSKKGLQKQLEFENYSSSEIDYALSHINVDWNEQAVRHAKHYLSTMAFSKSELYNQLIFEGYTEAEATHGVNVAYK